MEVLEDSQAWCQSSAFLDILSSASLGWYKFDILLADPSSWLENQSRSQWQAWSQVLRSFSYCTLVMAAHSSSNHEELVQLALSTYPAIDLLKLHNRNDCRLQRRNTSPWSRNTSRFPIPIRHHRNQRSSAPCFIAFMSFITFIVPVAIQNHLPRAQKAWNTLVAEKVNLNDSMGT